MNGNIEELVNFQNLTIHCKEPISGIDFYAKPMEVLLAEYKLNEEFAKSGVTTLRFFLESLGIKLTEQQKKDYIRMGWYAGCEDYTYFEGPWITFTHIATSGLSGSYFKIEMNPMPCSGWIECADVAGCCYDEENQ